MIEQLAQANVDQSVTIAELELLKQELEQTIADLMQQAFRRRSGSPRGGRAEPSVTARMWAYRGVTVPLNVFDFTVNDLPRSQKLLEQADEWIEQDKGRLRGPVSGPSR